jgi:hypothetical protein
LLWIALLVAIATLIFGFYSESLFQTPTWNPDGARRFLRYTIFFWAASITFYVIARRYYLPLLAFLVLVCTVYAVGVIPVLAIALITAAATSLGRWLFRSDWTLCFLAGLAIFGLCLAAVSRVPVHYTAVYVVALGAATVSAAGGRLRANARHEIPNAFGCSPSPSTYWMACLFAYVFCAHWLIVLKPEAGADALSMHLAIAFDMATRHVFTLDFPQFVWALMPMGADFCYALAYSIGGEFASRLLNLAMLACVASLIYRSVRSWLPTGGALLLCAAFVSSPIVQLITGTMMVENFLAALTLGAGVALWSFHEEPRDRSLLLCALLLGTAIGWKIGAVTIAATILPTLVYSVAKNWRKLARPRLTVLTSFAIFLLPAVLPYAIAFVRSGNPIYPFANDTFGSPYLTEVLEDYRFREPLTALTLFRVTFQTNRYYEGLQGSFGFQYLLLLPLSLVAFLRFRSLKEYSALATGLLGCILVGLSTPNARYFYPALAFLTVGFGAALGRIRDFKGNLYRLAMTSLAVVLGLNVWFLPTSNSYHRDFVPKPLFSKQGQAAYRAQAAPVREVIEYVNRQGGAVMFTGTSDFAGTIGPVYLNHWHNFSFNKRLQACRRPSDVHELATSLGIEHFISPDQHDKSTVDSAPSLFQYLEICAETDFRTAEMSARSIRPDCEERLRQHDPTYISDVLPSGIFDDMDARLKYRGTWQSKTSMQGAYESTLTFSNQPGAEARIRFSGRTVIYAYTKAFNRGKAQIEVDGNIRKVIDLYAKDVQWGVEERLSVDEPGRHEMIVRVLPQKNVASTGYYVDVDSVTVQE